MLVSAFDYHLPDELIAQKPARNRDQSRLLVLDRAAESYFDSAFDQLPNHLQRGDVLVLNNTRVFPARLIGRRVKALRTAPPAKPACSNPRDEIGSGARGARVEIFLVREVEALVWETLVRPGRALPIGATIEFGESELTGEIVERFDSGRRLIRFQTRYDFDRVIDRIGQTPLPPYIKRPEVNDDQLRLDAERYQTVYATARGAIAAPTAGLHFTPELLDRLRANGVEIVEITLHVGYGTFQPVRVETVEDHRVEPETYTITDDVAARLNRALAERRRVIAVGTTTTRALESAAIRGKIPGSSSQSTILPNIRASSINADGIQASSGDSTTAIRPGSATTELFIYPGFQFRVLSGLVTNFHLPRSSLLMLVSAFAGRELVLDAYRHAVEHEYRFYSYGDAMLIT